MFAGLCCSFFGFHLRDPCVDVIWRDLVQAQCAQPRAANLQAPNLLAWAVGTTYHWIIQVHLETRPIVGSS